MNPSVYRARLLEPLRTRERAILAAASPLPARVWFAPEQPMERPLLRDLFVNGVLCGHRETLDYLQTQTANFDRELADSRFERQAALEELASLGRTLGDERRMSAEHVRHLEAEVAAARRRVSELEQSTAWKITFPLRVAIHQLKAASRMVLSARQRARLLKPRIANARQVLKDEGALALLRRIRSKWQRRARPAELRPREGLAAEIVALHVPSSQAPRISVLVPTYGQDLHTYTCLRALAAEAQDTPLEVVVLDDAAPVPAAQALAAVSGVRFERSDRNLGFLRNCNRGIALARGAFVLLLNNDAVLGKGALKALLSVFEADPQAGAVGAKLVYPDGRLQEAGGIVWRDGSAWNFGRGDDPDKPEYNYVREADYCSAACLLVRRELLEKLGGFDEHYLPAYYEDTDLCFKVRAAGYKVYYQPAAEVVHFEGASHGTDVAAGVKSHQVENQRKFRERWQDALARHRTNGTLVRLERDRGARRRILFVEACMLTPDQDSGSVRTLRMLEILRGLGCKVTFAAENLERPEPYVSQLEQAGVEVAYAPHVRSIDSYIVEHGAEFDAVVLARYYVAAPYLDLVRRHAPHALMVLDTIDLHFLRNRRLAALEGSKSLAQNAQDIYRQEIECIRRVDLTWVVSDVERDVLAREVPQARVEILSNIHDIAPRPTPFAEREGILFVGGYRHPPNVDAALFYAREIAPRIHERLPNATTYLIGSNPPASITSIAAPGVEVVGYVPDLGPWLERCRLSVSPLRYGAGVKGKVNQSMSHGLPVVATSPSVEGMHLVHGEDVLVADTPEAFADAVVRLYSDEALWNRLSSGGIANVHRHFSREAAAIALESLLEQVERRSRLP